MKSPNPEIEKYRVKTGPMGSHTGLGNNGAFILPGLGKVKLFVIVSDGMGWEHVSVSPIGLKRCPTWEEMCYVKSLFWDPEETVLQYHPARSSYVNNYPYCLHMWRPVYENAVPMPPLYLV